MGTQKEIVKKIRDKKAEKFYGRIISLPIFPLLTKEQQDYVIGQVLEGVKEV